MISKHEEKKRAILLRKAGYSYNEIRSKVNVAKSTLSLWLRSVGMAQKHARRITDKQREMQKKAVEAWRQIRIKKTLRIKQKAASEIKHLTDRERWLMGICLYWAEGTKERVKGERIQFSNSDSRMILFFREWILDFLGVFPGDLIYSLYIHEKGFISQAILYWTRKLAIDPHELKIILKKHNPSPKRINIGVGYVGLIRITIRRSIDLNRRLSGWIDGIINKTVIIGE